MKTENIEQKLRDYYHEIKNKSAQTETAEDFDYNLIARYIDGIATPEEIVQLEKQAESNEELEILLQTITSQNPGEISQRPTSSVKFQIPNSKQKILKFFCLSKPTAISFLRCAACLFIIVTGSFFIIKKINSSSETDESQITLRSVTLPTNIYQPPITNKCDKISFQEKTNNN